MTTGGVNLEDEVALVRAIAEGEESALRRAIDLHGGPVYAAAQRVLGHPGLAEEASQDAFLALWTRPERFDRRRGSLRSFLVRISLNKSIDRIRQEEARRESSAPVENLQYVDESSSSVSQDAVDRDDVQRSLARLPLAQREALILVYFGGLTSREMAEELGIPHGTAKTRVRAALIKLRGYREEESDD